MPRGERSIALPSEELAGTRCRALVPRHPSRMPNAQHKGKKTPERETVSLLFELERADNPQL